ncbi:MAG: universal stress protein [Deltaproteobacteria bacterium]|nr:universal stress protein [Deltaproteobacteria bacterium]
MALKNRVNFGNILFPTDFSGASALAAGYALSLARQNRARLYCMHVMDTSNEAAGFYVPHLSFENLDEEMLVGAEEMLHKFAQKHLKGYKNVELRVTSGEPYREIVKAVKALKIDLCVMGTYGKAGLERLFIGSTTERVTRRAACPVLVIPPPR